MSRPQHPTPWLARWPAKRFYFDVLDTRSLGKRGRATDRELGYLLENVLPVPVETVHALFRDLGGGRFLACAIERDRLQAALSSEALVLVPDMLPAFLDAGRVNPDDLNLLVGALAPAPIRARRKRRLMASLAVALAVTALSA